MSICCPVTPTKKYKIVTKTVGLAEINDFLTEQKLRKVCKARIHIIKNVKYAEQQIKPIRTSTSLCPVCE